MTLALTLLAFGLTALAIHLASLAIVALRVIRAQRRLVDTGTRPAVMPAVTIVRPVSQTDTYLEDTLESTFTLDWMNVEILFCAAHESDPAVPTVRRLLAKYPGSNARLLIGTADISRNPKLNNCVKGWHAAAHDFVAVVDSNVLLPADYLHQMLGVWDEGCGMVSAPPVGYAPGNYWAVVECSFLNSHQARWQLIADELGSAFAQGKNLMFRKSILDPLGGIAALAIEPAEDAAATRILRQAGYHVRLSSMPFSQPLGIRSFKQLWSRQVRWAKLRHATFPAWYYPEILSGSALPLLVVTFGLWSIGVNPLAGFTMVASIWVGAETALSRWTGWHTCFRTPFAILTRDVLIPIIWFAGLTGKEFEWQGHRMSAKREDTPAAIR